MPTCPPQDPTSYSLRIALHRHCWVTCKWHMFIFSFLPNTNFSPSKYTEETGKANQEVLPFDGLLCFVCREENVPITAPIAKATSEFWRRIYFGWGYFSNSSHPSPPLPVNTIGVKCPQEQNKTEEVKRRKKRRRREKAKHCSSAFSKR